MADGQQRVHPAKEEEGKDAKKSSSPSGTYVIQFPKDQIYRVPAPPGSSAPPYKPRKPPRRRSPCCRCLAWTFGLLFAIIFMLAIAGVVLYLLYKPRIPKYSVESISVRRFNITGHSDLESLLDVTVRARNPNEKISIYYLEGNRLAVSYSGVELCKGGFGAFRQGTRNTTLVRATLKGSNVRLGGGLRSSLRKQQKAGSVPLRVNVRVPVKIKVGGLKLPKIVIKTHCDLTVDKLSPNENARIESKSCRVTRPRL